jgi:hypothetical protein
MIVIQERSNRGLGTWLKKDKKAMKLELKISSESTYP